MQGKSPSGEPAKQLAIEGVRRAILRGARVRIVPVAEAIAINECRRVLPAWRQPAPCRDRPQPARSDEGG
jgi:hypothetical protein